MQCISVGGTSCYVDSNSRSMDLNVTINTHAREKWGIGRVDHAEKKVRAFDGGLLLKWRITHTKSSIPEFSGLEGIAITHSRNVRQPLDSSVVLLRDPARDQLFFSSGAFHRWLSDNGSNPVHFKLTTPLRIWRSNLSSDEFDFFELFVSLLNSEYNCAFSES